MPKILTNRVSLQGEAAQSHSHQEASNRLVHAGKGVSSQDLVSLGKIKPDDLATAAVPRVKSGGASVINDLSNCILFGRGANSNDSKANQEYLMLVEQYKPKYQAQEKNCKRQVACELIDELTEKGFFFAKKHNNKFVRVSDKAQIVKKVQQCLREMKTPKRLKEVTALSLSRKASNAIKTSESLKASKPSGQSSLPSRSPLLGNKRGGIELSPAANEVVHGPVSGQAIHQETTPQPLWAAQSQLDIDQYNASSMIFGSANAWQPLFSLHSQSSFIGIPTQEGGAINSVPVPPVVTTDSLKDDVSVL